MMNEQITNNQVDELIKCYKDPIYFTNRYLRLDKNIPIALNKDQENLILNFNNNRFNLCKGDCSFAFICYALYYAIFNNYSVIGIFSGKQIDSKFLLEQIRTLNSNLPEWLKPTINHKLNTCLRFGENDSIIVADNLSSGKIRGQSFNVLFINNISQISIDDSIEFKNAVLPVVVSGKASKLIVANNIITNSPNYFDNMWNDKNSKFIKTELHE